MSSALVVEDGASPYVLAAVRSLGRAGWRVGVASPAPNPRVAPSRHLSRWHACRLPEADLEGFLDDVARAVDDGGYDLVLGADDVELLALSWGRDRVGALLPHASHEAVLSAVDKLTLTRAAESVGLGTPATDEADDAAVRAVDLPVVVKARLHWTPGSSAGGTGRHLLVRVCATRDEVREQVRAVEASGGRALLQRPVDGEQLAVSVVLGRDGEVLAVAQQRTLRSSLVRTSSRAETVAVDAELVRRCADVLRALGWWGIANLQLLRDADGVPRLIDLNGRYYGSLALAVAAGADLPAVWAADAVGRPRGPVQVARPGVRFHALHPDLLRARHERRGGLAQDVAGTLAFARGAVHSTWSREDPRPAAALARRVVADGLHRRARGEHG